MSERPKCSLCGEPMPPGEEMFQFHGFSGPCPKPTSGPSREVLLEMAKHEDEARSVSVGSLPADPVEAAEENLRFAQQLVRYLHDGLFPQNEFRVCDTLSAVLSQISNMIAGLPSEITTLRAENERLKAERDEWKAKVEADAPYATLGRGIIEALDAIMDAGVSESPEKINFDEVLNAFISTHAKQKSEITALRDENERLLELFRQHPKQAPEQQSSPRPITPDLIRRCVDEIEGYGYSRDGQDGYAALQVLRKSADTLAGAEWLLSSFRENNRDCHALLDEHGVQKADGEVCNDDKCQSALYHRIKMALAESQAKLADRNICEDCERPLFRDEPDDCPLCPDCARELRRRATG